jgi:hypothetical protein
MQVKHNAVWREANSSCKRIGALGPTCATVLATYPTPLHSPVNPRTPHTWNFLFTRIKNIVIGKRFKDV